MYFKLNSPCFLEIFHAGPSSERSTSICLSLVALPNVICVNENTKSQIVSYLE